MTLTRSEILDALVSSKLIFFTAKGFHYSTSIVPSKVDEVALEIFINILTNANKESPPATDFNLITSCTYPLYTINQKQGNTVLLKFYPKISQTKTRFKIECENFLEQLRNNETYKLTIQCDMTGVGEISFQPSSIDDWETWNGQKWIYNEENFKNYITEIIKSEYSILTVEGIKGQHK